MAKQKNDQGKSSGQTTTVRRDTSETGNFGRKTYSKQSTDGRGTGAGKSDTDKKK